MLQFQTWFPSFALTSTSSAARSFTSYQTIGGTANPALLSQNTFGSSAGSSNNTSSTSSAGTTLVQTNQNVASITSNNFSLNMTQIGSTFVTKNQNGGTTSTSGWTTSYTTNPTTTISSTVSSSSSNTDASTSSQSTTHTTSTDNTSTTTKRTTRTTGNAGTYVSTSNNAGTVVTYAETATGTTSTTTNVTVNQSGRIFTTTYTSTIAKVDTSAGRKVNVWLAEEAMYSSIAGTTRTIIKGNEVFWVPTTYGLDYSQISDCATSASRVEESVLTTSLPFSTLLTAGTSTSSVPSTTSTGADFRSTITLEFKHSLTTITSTRAGSPTSTTANSVFSSTITVHTTTTGAGTTNTTTRITGGNAIPFQTTYTTTGTYQKTTTTTVTNQVGYFTEVTFTRTFGGNPAVAFSMTTTQAVAMATTMTSVKSFSNYSSLWSSYTATIATQTTMTITVSTTCPCRTTNTFNASSSTSGNTSDYTTSSSESNGSGNTISWDTFYRLTPQGADQFGAGFKSIRGLACYPVQPIMLQGFRPGSADNLTDAIYSAIAFSVPSISTPIWDQFTTTTTVGTDTSNTTDSSIISNRSTSSVPFGANYSRQQLSLVSVLMGFTATARTDGVTISDTGVTFTDSTGGTSTSSRFTYVNSSTSSQTGNTLFVTRSGPAIFQSGGSYFSSDLRAATPVKYTSETYTASWSFGGALTHSDDFTNLVTEGGFSANPYWSIDTAVYVKGGYAPVSSLGAFYGIFGGAFRRSYYARTGGALISTDTYAVSGSSQALIFYIHSFGDPNASFDFTRSQVDTVDSTRIVVMEPLVALAATSVDRNGTSDASSSYRFLTSEKFPYLLV